MPHPHGLAGSTRRVRRGYAKGARISAGVAELRRSIDRKGALGRQLAPRGNPVSG